MRTIKNCAFSAIALGVIFILSSCASVPKPPPLPAQEVMPPVDIAEIMPRQDICHVVAPGETLWRIAKMYDVKIDDITGQNNISESIELKMGQKLLIPQAAPLKPVVPLYKSHKWKHIIIHHSATDEGNALSFFRLHVKRGFWRGLGYHFVIDNGTYGKEDGQIEVSPRWINQEDGAHTKAGNMNHMGIGVCLVGNFSTGKVTDKQMESLVYLVNILRKYYNIPVENIMGHGKVRGAKTECPGKFFPWREFLGKLKDACWWQEDTN